MVDNGGTYISDTEVVYNQRFSGLNIFNEENIDDEN